LPIFKEKESVGDGRSLSLSGPIQFQDPMELIDQGPFTLILNYSESGKKRMLY